MDTGSKDSARERRARAVADVTAVMATVADLVRGELPNAADILLCPTGGEDFGMDDVSDDPRPMPPSPLMLTHIRDASGRTLWADDPHERDGEPVALDPALVEQVGVLLEDIERHASAVGERVAGWRRLDTAPDRSRAVLVTLPAAGAARREPEPDGTARRHGPLTLAWGHTLAVVLTAMYRQVTFAREVDGEWIEAQPLRLADSAVDGPPPDLRDAQVIVLIPRTGREETWALAELVPDWTADRLRH